MTTNTLPVRGPGYNTSVLRTVTPLTPARWSAAARPGALVFVAVGAALLGAATVAGTAMAAIGSVGLGIAGGAVLWRLHLHH